MSIKDDWINIDKNREDTINEDVKELKEQILTDLGLGVEKDWKLIEVTQKHRTSIKIDSMFRIPLHILTFLEDTEGFWFDKYEKKHSIVYDPCHAHEHGFLYHYYFLREDRILSDRRFYEKNYPVVDDDGEGVTPSSSSSSLGAEII